MKHIKIFMLMYIIGLHAAHGDIDPQYEFERTRNQQVQGVRSVGQGGGYAEMLAIRINLNLSNLNLIKLASTDFQISPKCEDVPVKISTHPLSVSLSTCALYTVDQGQILKPKTYQEIAIWVLTARLMAEQQNLQKAYSTASNVLRDFNIQEQLCTGFIGLNSIVIRDTFGNLSQNEFHSLIVSSDSDSIEIANQIESALDCSADQMSWQLSDLIASEISETELVIDSQIQWKCRDQKFSAKIQASVSSSENPFKLRQVAIRIFNRNKD